MAKFRTNHDWDFADLHLITLIQSLLTNYRSYAFFISFALFELLYFDSNVDFCLISQAAQPGLMRKDRFVNAVFFKVSRELVNSDIAEVNAINGVFVVLTKKLSLLDNVLGFELFDHFLHTVLQETLKRENLLGDQPILFKVAVNDLPGVVLVDRVHVSAERNGSVGLHN